MRDISTEAIRFLLLLALVLGTARGQEGDDSGDQAEQPRSLGLIPEMADPAAWMSMGEHPFDVRQFYSRRLREQEELPEGAATTKGGILFPQGKIRVGNRDEWVLARLDGPGVITRIWMARPLGQLRLRVDGEAETVLDVECEAVLGGYIAIFAPPFSMKRGEGGLIRRPMPF